VDACFFQAISEINKKANVISSLRINRNHRVALRFFYLITIYFFLTANKSQKTELFPENAV